MDSAYTIIPVGDVFYASAITRTRGFTSIQGDFFETEEFARNYLELQKKNGNSYNPYCIGHC